VRETGHGSRNTGKPISPGRKSSWAKTIGEDPLALHDESVPFSKSVAVNDAARKAKGDVFVIVDADGYVSADAVLLCAKQIRRARAQKHRLWYVPYRQFYRLTEDATARVIESDPKKPYVYATPPHDQCILDTSGSQHGHWYGAMIQIMSREAFDAVGGWDPRFRGWGGEDHAAMRAMDTLYWRHKTMPIQVLHLWHPMFSPEGTSAWVDWRYRMWRGQTKAGANDDLSGRYYGANGDPVRMRKLVNEWREPYDL
jgi:glycosyltransferase involved in cell wall biosynthesis